MKKIDEAELVFQKSVEEALGFIELAKMASDAGRDNSDMRQQAIRALQRFSDDDELIDAMYDADMEEQRREERHVMEE